MSVIYTILIGLVVGLVARMIHPGRDDLGIIMTIVLGVAGSLLASYGGQAVGIYHAGQGAGFIGAVIGAVIILVVYSMLKKK